jgi:hypothetical protein
MVQATPVRDDAGNISEWIGIAVDSLAVDAEMQTAGEFKSISPVSTH